MHFRWSKITALFLRPFGPILGSLFLLFPLSLLIVDFILQRRNIQYIRYEYYRGLLYLTFLFSIVVVHIILVLAAWYKERFTFFEAEHFFILIVVAIYSSAFFGILNYGLYKLDNTSFQIDEVLRAKEFSKKLLSTQKRVEELRKVADASERLAAEINNLPREFFRKSRHAWIFGPTYKFDVNVDGASVFLDTQTYTGGGPTGGGVSVTIWTVEADAWGEEITISPHVQFDSNKVIEPLREEIVEKQALVRAFEYRAEWERSHRLVALEEQLRKEQEGGAEAMALSWTLFLYQGAMDALGSSPEYFKPASFLTRLIAFFNAFLKSIYFGIFVALIVMKKWAHSRKKSPPNRMQIPGHRLKRSRSHQQLKRGRRRLTG